MSDLLKKISDAAKSRFAELQFPHRKDEHWRFSALNEWGVEALFPFFTGKIGSREASASAKKLSLTERRECAGNAVKIYDAQTVLADLPKGVEFFSMAEAAEKFSERVEEFYSLTDGKFDALVAAKAGAGAYIKVAEGTRAQLSIATIAKLPVSVCALIFDIGANSSLKIWRDSLAFDSSFSVLRTGWFVGAETELEIVNFKNSGESARSYEREDFRVLEGTKITDVLAQVAPSPSRHEKNFEILGGRADIDSRAFLKIDGDITHDLRTSQMHRVPSSKSNLAVMATIDSKSSLAFRGIIRVDENAQKTKSYQSCRSLLLSKDAKAQAEPILEIIANDVECSHGCAVSKPKTEELFYMNSRGLDSREALKLLARGFAETAFEKISDRERIEKYLDQTFQNV